MKLEPRWVPSLVALVFVLLFARLGVWQIQRYQQAAALSSTIRAAWELAPLESVDATIAADAIHRRASLHGQWVDPNAALIRGGLVAGIPGYHLIGVFAPTHGPPIVVDRGWVPTSSTREQLDDLAPAGTVDIEGLLVLGAGDSSLQPQASDIGIDRWPMVTDLAYGLFHRVLGPPYGAIARAHPAQPLRNLALVQGPMLTDEPDRRLGPLPVPGYVLPLPRTHHLSYAGQWFAFALGTVALWGWLSRKR